MFDPVAVEIIKSAPELDGIVHERLPEYLSEMYTKIVNLRRKIIIPEITIDKNDHEELQKLWRMAHTYSALTIGGRLDKKQKFGAAFVAGNAFNLIWQANKIGLTSFQSINEFTDLSISPVILSSILFMIAEQPADAYEASEKIELKTGSLSSIDILEQAISHLVRGSLKEISKLPESDTETLNIANSSDLEAVAYQILWDGITEAIRKLSHELLNVFNNNETTSWRSLLSDVIDISLNTEKTMNFDFKSSFAAPYHLACLLLEMGDELYQKSVIRVPTPLGIDQHLWEGYLETIAQRRPYLWKNHYSAIQSGFLTPGVSSIITFPTGAGKSTIAEFKIVSTLLSGKSVVFLTPTKALVDQVERDLKKTLEQYFTEDNLKAKLFASEPTDSSSDDFINGSVVEDSYFIDFEEGVPSVSVMTPERCLSIMSVEKESFFNTGLIVFDECHLLHGGGTFIERRGIDAMFALLNLLSIPESKPDVLLASAMVENGDKLAGWLSDILGRDCLSLDIRWKPTRQARGCVIYNHDRISELKKLVDKSLSETTNKTPPGTLKNQLSISPEGLFCLKQTWNTQSSEDYTKIGLLNDELLITASGNRPYWNLTPNRNKVAAKIGQFFSEMGIKTLVFADSPKNANSIATEAAGLIHDSPKIVYQEADRKLLDICIAEIGSPDYIYQTIDKKTACHHGLLFLPERRLAEQVFRRNDETGINLLSATPTLAQGMNLPVELVILAGDDRYDRNADSRELLKAHELLNASGRAGRAGWIATGLVILVPSEIIAIQENEDGITLNSHWFKLRELIYSQEDQCLEIIDPLDLCLDAIQGETENNRREVEYFLQRLPKLQEKNASDLLKRSFGFYKSKQDNTDVEYLSKISLAEDRIRKPTPEEFETWIEAVATETGINSIVINDITNILPELDLTINSIEWVDYIICWLMDQQELFSELLPVEELLSVFKKRMNDSDSSYSILLSELSSLIKLWMRGETISSMAEWLGDTREKCKNIRIFIIRLLPNISFIFGLFPLVYRKMIENIGSEDVIPAAFGSLAGCIREGFDCPEKLAMYHITIKQGLTSRVQIHQKYDEVEIEEVLDGTVESYDNLSKRVWEVLNNRK
ncbi:MAG: DEAD/DEAH box helicase [Deltaproteobacteria bacterium]|nr:DEAD/DEAH box helicase [Deltaproteobacteria bacterium]